MARLTTTRPRAKPAAKQSPKTQAKAPRAVRAKPAPARAAPAVRPSKDALRAQVEKLEKTVATLRQKNREMKRTAGEDANRVEELEATVQALERRLAAHEAPPGQKKGRAAGTRRKREGVDPGDAVPPGVAVEEPEDLSDSDRAVLAHLNETLAPT